MSQNATKDLNSLEITKTLFNHKNLEPTTVYQLNFKVFTLACLGKGRSKKVQSLRGRHLIVATL